MKFLKLFLLFMLIPPVEACFNSEHDCASCVKVKNCAFYVTKDGISCHPNSVQIMQVKYKAVRASQCINAMKVAARIVPSITPSPSGLIVTTAEKSVLAPHILANGETISLTSSAVTMPVTRDSVPYPNTTVLEPSYRQQKKFNPAIHNRKNSTTLPHLYQGVPKDRTKNMETSTSSIFYQNSSKIELYKKAEAQQPTKFPIMVGNENDFGMTSTSAAMQTNTTASVRVPWTTAKVNVSKQSTKTLIFKHGNTSIGLTAVKSEFKNLQPKQSNSTLYSKHAYQKTGTKDFNDKTHHPVQMTIHKDELERTLITSAPILNVETISGGTDRYSQPPTQKQTTDDIISPATIYLDNSSTRMQPSTTRPPKAVNLTIAFSSNGTNTSVSFNSDDVMSIKPDQQEYVRTTEESVGRSIQPIQFDCKVVMSIKLIEFILGIDFNFVFNKTIFISARCLETTRTDTV
ncbi:unnamed protein product [Orchesella dallaii]|uniref:Uncharacterized protein n=1 Tax=Orchesella dallaii TaxID=48710 RepID=A0ABP1RAB0_9HEXA